MKQEREVSCCSRMFSSFLVVFSFVGILAPGFSGATEFHVAMTGNDSSSGTQAQPFRTIAKASGKLAAGDVCVIHAGTYREIIQPLNSGADGRPITYRSAGDGKVTISGADVVNGWTVHSGSIYKTSPGWTLGAWNDQVFVNGKMMVPARFPNVPISNGAYDLLSAPLASASIAAGSSVMVVPRCTQPNGFWNGATLWGSIGAKWSAQTAYVTASTSSGKLTLTGKSSPWFPDDYPSISGEGKVYLAGILGALDAPGEWHIQNGVLYLMTPGKDNPAGHVVEVKRRSMVMDLGVKNWITVKGLGFIAGRISLNGSDCVVSACTFMCVNQCEPANNYYWNSGLEIGGSGNLMVDCIVDTASGNGIDLGGSYNTVRNCIVRNTDYNGDNSAAILLNGSNNLVEQCTLVRSGRMLVRFYGYADIICYNDMSASCLLTEDCGQFYTWGLDGGYTEIAYNWVHGDHSQKGVGIYLDDGSRNFLVHHNCSWDNNDGMRMGHIQDASGHRVYNNTFWANRSRSMAEHGKGTLSNILTYNNLSDRNDFIGTTKLNNLYTNNARFADLANRDFRPLVNSPAINYGRVIAGITDGYTGSKPDAGAYEYGSDDWIAGSLLELNNDPVQSNSVYAVMDDMDSFPAGGTGWNGSWLTTGYDAKTTVGVRNTASLNNGGSYLSAHVVRSAQLACVYRRYDSTSVAPAGTAYPVSFTFRVDSNNGIKQLNFILSSVAQGNIGRESSAALMVVPNGALTFSQGVVVPNMTATVGHVFKVSMNVAAGSFSYTAVVSDLTAGKMWHSGVLRGRSVVSAKSYFNTGTYLAMGGYGNYSVDSIQVGAGHDVSK